MQTKCNKTFRSALIPVMLLAALMFLAWACATDPRDLPVNLPLPPSLNIPASLPATVKGGMLFVDNQLGQDNCTNYAPDSRRCESGRDRAFRTLQQALQTASAGNTIAIRQGRYAEQVAPLYSGIPRAPIIIRNFGDEPAIISDLNIPAINLKQKYYIIIQGLRIESVLGWGRLEDSAHNIIQENQFYDAQARGTTGGLKLVRSHYNQILGNSFNHGNDSIVIQASDRNIIAGNIMTWARHSLLSVRCGNFNVIRGNRFHNQRQKAMEIYDCEGISDAPFRLDATKRNLIEGNYFTYTRGPSQPKKYNAIQYSGQYGVVRNNVFYANQGGGINVQVYADEALYNYGHRIYHNTFYANSCYGFATAPHPGAAYGDIVVINNLFFLNKDCRGNPVQTDVYSLGTIQMINNAIIGADANPEFVSQERRDLSLQAGSPMVDSGYFLTQTVSEGSGCLLPVGDVKYFYDGFGIDNELGDTIQLAGTSQKARVVDIDYNAKILKLDRPLTWKAHQGIAIAYKGRAPDIGAFEFGAQTAD